MPQQLPDTRIPLSGLSGGLGGGGGQASPGPLGTLGAMMKIKEEQQEFQRREREAEAARLAQEDDDELRWALQTYDRPDEAVDHLWKAGRAGVALKLSKSVAEERKARLEQYGAKVKSDGERLGQAAQILQGVKDDRSYQTARPAVLALVEPIYGQTINDALPTTYDEGRIQALVKAGTTRALTLQDEHNDVMEAQNLIQLGVAAGPPQPVPVLDAQGNPVIDPATGQPKMRMQPGMRTKGGLEAIEGYNGLLTRRLSKAPTQQVWDATLEQGYNLGAPLDLLKGYGPWNEDATKRAQQLGLTIPQEETGKVAQTNAAANLVRARATAARAAAGGAGGGGLTRSERRIVDTKADDEYEEVEEWARERHAKAFENAPLVVPDPDRPGKTKPAGPAPDFSLQQLSKADQLEYVRRRLRIENNRRRNSQMKSIDDAAKEAAETGDVAGYEKLRDMYDDLTQGLVPRLETRIPPPPGTRRATTLTSRVAGPTPAQTDTRKRLDEINALLMSTRSAAEREKLIKEQKQLLGLK
jgi:hypothetical protein